MTDAERATEIERKRCQDYIYAVGRDWKAAGMIEKYDAVQYLGTGIQAQAPLPTDTWDDP